MSDRPDDPLNSEQYREFLEIRKDSKDLVRRMKEGEDPVMDDELLKSIDNYVKRVDRWRKSL